MAKSSKTKTPAPKKPSLDIKDEMYHADRKNYDWLSAQDPELQKSFSPLVAMKWLSVTTDQPRGIAEYYLMMTNAIVNVGFWDLAKHPDLQWRLMCATGCGTPQRHGWIALSHKRKTVNKLDAFLLTLHPQLNDDELLLLKSKFTRESFKQLLLDTGMTDADMKPLMDDFKKHYG
jgi:hypothetical protein